MSEFKTIREKAIERKIDNIISGEENAELNMLMKMAYLGNYDERMLESLKKKREEDLALLLKEFQITDIQETTNCKTELIIKSNDNVDGEDRIQGSDNQGQQDIAFKHSDHICYST
jgi:hypothetical protein